MKARKTIGKAAPAAAISLAVTAGLARGQVTTVITQDTFIDSGSPGTYNPATGMPNDPGTIVNGEDIYSYGADGKVKAVTSSYSSTYPYVSATHVLFQLPTTFWNGIGSQPIASAVVNYYAFNDSLSIPDTHGAMELHPLTHPFTVGNGTQSPLVPSTDGGATWDTYDGSESDLWTTPGGDFDAANYVLDDNTTLPASKGSVPFSWDITSLVDNSTARSELQANGALLKVQNEGVFPNNPPPPSGENDFVSFYSADYETAMGTSNPAFLPTVVYTLAFTWTNAGADNQWNTSSTNWNNGEVANALYIPGAAVIFDDSNGNAANYAVTLGTVVSPATVTVNNSANNYVISGTGGIGGSGSLFKSGSSKLTLETANSYTGGTTVSAGTLVAAVSGSLPDGSVVVTGGALQLEAGTGLTTISGLTISGGTLDLANNHMIITYTGTTPMPTVLGYLSSGYNNGGWNGMSGIVSSTAALQDATSGALKYGIGWADGGDGTHNVAGLSSGQIELKYTLLGDANLDGGVNGSDFSILAANFGLGVTNWDQGNFLFGSSVNGSDFSALAANFGQGDSGNAVTPADIAALDAFAAANGLTLPTTAAVPEPATVGIGLLAGVGCLSRRRRK